MGLSRTVLVVMLTVLEVWSAVHTRSAAEIGGAEPTSVSACTGAEPVGAAERAFESQLEISAPVTPRVKALRRSVR